MEGLVYGVAAMIVKDMLKTPYLKGRDYERNVRQVYRDVDNLQITLDQTKSNCEGQSLSKPHADFVKRAEKQKRDSYRILRKNYPRYASKSQLLEYASTPGAEMNLLDIGKEANQTAKGLNDLLAEIRFAKIGGGDKEDDKEKENEGGGKQKEKSPTRPSLDLSKVQSADAPSRGSSSPRSMSSRHGSVFSPIPIQPIGIYSPPSSTSSFGDPTRRRSTSSSKRRSQSSQRHLGHHKQELLTPSSWPKTNPFETIMETGREREQALDNLQHGIDQVLGAVDQEHEYEAMTYLEHALKEVLRLQRAQGFSGSQMGEDLGDAVDELDLAMRNLVAAKTDKQKDRALKALSFALEGVDIALYARRKRKEQSGRHHHASPVRVSSKRHGKGSSERSRSRRYSMQSEYPE
ncbi:hypothetical protein KVR01_013523 [Diaporthe batatas]|uniref:uncharacterized protein n=1 Tax=Diaporthe batatas TaxID=748121 RepID=UPI001D0599E4|nr:uncharacterized protein KVR01_013523 [Diaporthe batatas]KAG8156572.1 hypothetical protein KVR01_013523 [Diaporthe batatas]